MNEFGQIKNYTDYSILSVGKMQDFVLDAAEKGIKILGITDSSNLGGCYSFNKYCEENDIFPVLGTVLNFCNNRKIRFSAIKTEEDIETFHLTAYARNFQGLQSLYKISREANISTYYVPRIDIDLLENSDLSNLVFSTGTPESYLGNLIYEGRYKEAEKHIRKLKNIGAKFVFEITPHIYSGSFETNMALCSLSEKFKIPCIFVNNTRFKNEKDFQTFELLKSEIKIPTDRKMSVCKDNYLSTFEQVYLLFNKNYPELEPKFIKKIISNTAKFYEKYIEKYEFDKSGKLPEFTGSVIRSYELIKEEVKNGLRSKGLWKDEYKKRAKHELEIIRKKGFQDYFLMVSDLVRWAKNSGIIVGPSRGSAGGSLVSYLLDIIEIDPIKTGLLFERFLDETRADYPDIDIDFEKNKRHLVDDYLIQKYGKERVIPIGTNLRYGPSNGIKHICKAFGFTEDELNDVTRAIKPLESFDEAFEHGIVRDFFSDKEHILYHIKAIQGQIFAFGKHASGIVVSSRDVILDSPLSITKGETCTRYIDGKDERELSELGIVKIDRLGLKNLDVAKRCIEYVSKIHGEEIDYSNIPEGDDGAFEIFQAGATTTIFQFSEFQSKKLLRQIKPTSIDDLSMITAVNRPGPIGAGLVDKLIENRFLPESEWEKYHPIVDEILKPTFGVLIYQEQVMQIAKNLALFDPVQSNHLRKIIKKSSGSTSTDDERSKNKKNFIDGCKKNGVSSEVADHVYEMCASFASYSFNRCLSGDEEVLDSFGQKHKIEDLIGESNIFLKSYDTENNKIFNDRLLNVFETGEQELFEVEFDDGNVVCCTLEHKFLSETGEFLTLREIFKRNLGIVQCHVNTQDQTRNL